MHFEKRANNKLQIARLLNDFHDLYCMCGCVQTHKYTNKSHDKLNLFCWCYKDNAIALFCRCFVLLE